LEASYKKTSSVVKDPAPSAMAIRPATKVPVMTDKVAYSNAVAPLFTLNTCKAVPNAANGLALIAASILDVRLAGAFDNKLPASSTKPFLDVS